jgi:hypothetical protein
MLFLKTSTFLGLILASCIAVAGQTPDVVPPGTARTEIFLAKDDGTGKAGDEATSFVTTDVPIYCVVLLESAEPTTVKMNLVAVAVPGVRPGTKVVSTTYTTRDNEDRVNFSGRPAGQWVAGRYRVDIFIGNATAVSREFAVQKAVQAKPKPSKPKSSDKSPLAGPVVKN